MSVVIRGMKMPKKCTECPFVIKSNSPKYPFVDCEIIGRLGSVFNCIGIPVDCPLVELPAQHGRLIDAYELAIEILKLQKYRFSIEDPEIFVSRNAVMQAISDNPTVIEAEEVSG